MELERIRIRETRRRQEEDAREVQAAVAASIESAKAENEARRMRADFEIAAQLQVEEVSEDDQILTKQTREEENALPWVPAVREHERERRENQDAFDMLGWGDASSYVEPRSNLARSSEMPAREESRSPAVDSLRRMLAEAERERKCDDFKRGIICEAIEGMEEEQVILSIMETCMRKLSFRSLNQVPDMMERRLAGRR
jgi:hypothetical protein